METEPGFRADQEMQRRGMMIALVSGARPAVSRLTQVLNGSIINRGRVAAHEYRGTKTILYLGERMHLPLVMKTLSEAAFREGVSVLKEYPKGENPFFRIQVEEEEGEKKSNIEPVELKPVPIIGATEQLPSSE